MKVLKGEEQIDKDRMLIINVMAESVGRVYHASLADTLDRISLVNIKKLTNKRPIGLNGHLSTIAHTQNCRGVSYMHLINFHSEVLM